MQTDLHESYPLHTEWAYLACTYPHLVLQHPRTQTSLKEVRIRIFTRLELFLKPLCASSTAASSHTNVAQEGENLHVLNDFFSKKNAYTYHEFKGINIMMMMHKKMSTI